MATVRFTANNGEIRALIGPSGEVGRDMRRRGNRVLSEAKRRCPVDTGKLRASLRMEELSNGTITIGTPLNYAIHVHEGTRYMRGRPFLRDALPAANR